MKELELDLIRGVEPLVQVYAKIRVHSTSLYVERCSSHHGVVSIRPTYAPSI